MKVALQVLAEKKLRLSYKEGLKYNNITETKGENSGKNKKKTLY